MCTNVFQVNWYRSCFHQHVRLHTIHITYQHTVHIICKYDDNIMRFHRYHRIIQGPGWEGGMAFSMPRPKEVIRRGLSSVQDWEWQQRCSFDLLNQRWWDWRINVSNQWYCEWLELDDNFTTSNVYMSSPAFSVASPIVALLFTNRFFGRLGLGFSKAPASLPFSWPSLSARRALRENC